MFALAAAGRQAGLTFDLRLVLDAASPTNGFSLAELQEIARAAGLTTVPVIARATGEMPVPSVAHLKDGHYVAVLTATNGLLRVFDPGLKAERRLTEADFAEVATGYFLALPDAGAVRAASVPLAEARDIRGRTSSCPPEDGEDGGGGAGGPCEPDDGTTEKDVAEGAEPPGCPPVPDCECETSCPRPGMAVWSVSEPYVNLWITDVPLRYQPTKGPAVAPRVAFKQRAESVPTGMSGNWMLGWSSRADLDPFGGSMPGGAGNPLNWSGFTFTMPSGARRTFGFHLTIADYDPNCECWHYGYGTASDRAFDGAYAEKDLVNNAVLLRLPDGRVFEYRQGSGSLLFVLKFVWDRGGKKHAVGHDGSDRVTSIVDADGRTTTLTYTTVNGQTLLWKVTTPDNNYCEFGYGLFGPYNIPLLTSVKDAVGIISSVGYTLVGSTYLPTSLTTPYGTTTFEHQTFQGPFTRFLKVTESDGTREIVALSEFGGYDEQFNPFPPAAFAADQLPVGAPDPNTGDLDAGLPYGTLKLSQRNEQNSYRWKEPAIARIAATTGLDPEDWRWKELKRARIQHWLNWGGASHPQNALSHVQQPAAAEDGNGEPIEGGLTFYDYADKIDPSVPGVRHWPAVILQRLPGVSDSTWRYEERDDEGKILKRKSTYTLANGTRGIRVDAQYEYDSNGNALREKDEAGLLRREYEWNGFHRRTLFREYHTPAANSSDPNKYYTTTYQYDATTQRMTQRVAPTGLTTTWSYTAGGNPGSYTVTATDSPVNGGNRVETRVIVDGLMTSHTDWRGLTRTFQYDGLGRLKKTTWPDSTYTETTFTRTVNGQPQMILDPVTVRDRLGYLTTYTYDGLRRRLTVKDARNNTTTFTYCPCGSVDTITDPLGNKTVYGYDYAARRTSAQVLKPDQTVVASTTYAYDLLNRLVSQTDAGGTRTFSYDHQGHQVAVTQDGKLFSRTIYDAEDRPATVVDRNGVAVTQAFDALGRLKTRTDPNSGVNTYGYSARGLTSHVNELNKTSTYAYDEAGRKTSETTPNSETLTYTYNVAGDLLTLTDGRGKVTTWTYDSGNQGRLWKKKYAGDAFDQIVYAYNANGWLTSRRYHTSAGAYQETLYTYDANGNLTLVNYPSGTTDITLAYDANNRVTTMTDASGTTAYTYTAWGAVLTEDGPGSGTTDRLTYAYDQARRRTGLTLDQPGGGTFATTYGYDAAGRPNSVVSPAGTFGYTYKAVSYSGQNYAGGLVQTLDQPGAYQVDGTFDALGRRLTTVLKNGAATVNSHTYVYNAGHQRTKQTLTDASYVDYAYDHLGQLDTALTKTSGGSPVSGQQFDYGYDAGWNLTSRATGSGTTSYGVNDRNQVVSGGGVGYGHDAHGNRTTESLGSGSLSYTYDAEQQLVGVATDTYYTPESGRWKVAFTYDGRGRVRVRQDYYWSGGNWYLNTDRRYVYDGMLLVQERTASQVPLVSYTRGVDLSGSLAGAGGIGGLLARSTHATTSPYAVNSSAYYHADGNGNVTYLVRSDGGAYASYRYDPYGRTLSSAGTLAYANAMRFSSKPVVLVNGTTWGCYYYGYRFYDPTVGRWINRDPIEESGGVNLYGYVFNAPVDLYDPDGKMVLIPDWILFPRRSVCPSNGFSLCQRDIDPSNWYDFPSHIANMMGGEHAYLRCDGPDNSFWGYGFGDGGVAKEKSRRYNRCTPCSRSNKPLLYGTGQGKSGTVASDAEIKECIEKSPQWAPYRAWAYNCQHWAKESAKDCGLSCR